MHRAMLSKSLIQFSVEGRGLCSLKPNYGGGNEDMGTFFKRSHACTAILSAPNLLQATADPRLHQTLGHTQASLAQSLVGSLLLSPGSWCTQGSVCALQEPVSPVLCKFWRLYGGVHGDLLGLCHTQACCRAGDTECSNACMGLFEGGRHYLHYLHQSLASGQKHSPDHQQKIGLKVY